MSISKANLLDKTAKVNFLLMGLPRLLFSQPMVIVISFFFLFRRGPYRAMQSLYDALIEFNNQNNQKFIDVLKNYEMYCCAVIDRRSKIIMDFSEKCGHTVSVKMFFRHLGTLDKALRYHHWVHFYRIMVFSKRDPVTRQDLNDPDYFKFKVVRNPYSRAVSSYLHAMKEDLDDKDIMGLLEIDHKNISFSRFVEYLSKANLMTCNRHWRLQKKEYEYENPMVFDSIIKLESIKQGISKINKIKGVNFDLQGIASHHHIKKHGVVGGFANTLWSEIGDKMPRYRAFYTDELVRRVGEIYKDDIEAYDYSYQAENI